MCGHSARGWGGKPALSHVHACAPHARVPVPWLPYVYGSQGVTTTSWSALQALPGLRLLVADAHGVPLAAVAPPARTPTTPPAVTVLVMGNEAHGPVGLPQGLPHTRVRIPMAPGSESLNVGVAAGILMHALSPARAPGA